uniref:SRCR domain-containing protein n=1 Tax=Heterorhabditis bacteriophora TaxID=37862 RepID=A0A1I7XVU1_HETBA
MYRVLSNGKASYPVNGDCHLDPPISGGGGEISCLDGTELGGPCRLNIESKKIAIVNDMRMNTT